MTYACTEHIDNAIDDYVDRQQTAPEVTFVREWKKADGSPLDVQCDYCRERATYVLLLHRAKSDQ